MLDVRFMWRFKHIYKIKFYKNKGFYTLWWKTNITIKNHKSIKKKIQNIKPTNMSQNEVNLLSNEINTYIVY